MKNDNYARLSGFDFVFWGAFILAAWMFPNHLPFLTLILIYGLFALALDIALGYAGILTVGHAAFFGLGAYAAGLFSIYGSAEPLTGLVVAAIVSLLAGYLLSFLIVRGSDLSRLMITIGTVVIFGEVIRRFSQVTGGTDGLLGITIDPLFSLFEFDFDGKLSFVYTYVVTLALFFWVRRLVRSPFGYSVRGIHENPTRMLAMGTPITQRLRWAYAISALIAGVAGALLAQTNQFVGIETVSFDLSAQILIILVLGGAGRLYGGLIGAVIYMILHDVFADMSPEYWMFWLGLFLILIVSVGKGGIMTWIDTWRFRKEQS
ncbi:MAG TPA: branched-chain amino acid ABC transporter permease [Paenalcaligenes hominis]|uniref:Branched-chain amino acid ABC transporter permease n=1 Tax=Paenalcaligenes hominis TaxID=643674 RepID=A0A9D2VGB3_9BURK|nr:branched-chain amino acid ABC transporter permease [Paenalcaligenes hominis]